MEDLLLRPAATYVTKAYQYWLANRDVHGFTYFFTWLNHTQGVTRLYGFENMRQYRGNTRDGLLFQDEQAKLMFILKWG